MEREDVAPERQELRTRPMEDADIPAVVELHRRFLGYSVNSRFGAAHLSYLYKITRDDSSSMVLVAICGGEVAGVVSATLDPERLMRRLLRSLSLLGWLRLFSAVLANPLVLLEWFESRDLGGPAVNEGRVVAPCLTAIAVDNRFRKAGIGKALVAGVEDFCRSEGYDAFRLDTREDNETSRIFYKRLGFYEVEKRGKNIMLVKML